MNSDDPKFTAHALGELDDLTPAERSEIEALLASDPSAASEADEMRALAARLRSELPGEEAARLNETQRTAVIAASTQPAPIAKVLRFPHRASILAAIAACLVVGASLALLFPAMQAEKNAARKSLAKIPQISTEPTGYTASASAPMAAITPPVTASPFIVSLKADHPPVELTLAPEQNGTLASNSPMLPVPALRGATAFPPPPSPVPLAEPPSTLATLPVSQTVKDALAMTPADVTSPPNEVGQKLAAFTAEWARARTASVASTPAPAPASTRSAGDLDGRMLEKRKDISIPDNEGTADSFNAPAENGFFNAKSNPLSTFSIDVDTASYSLVRRFLNDNRRPPLGAVRIEELLNYFTYQYPQPKAGEPFSAAMEVAACPWTPEHRLVRIALKGREIAKNQRPASNLVFLIDVSGSMKPENKLPLLKQSLSLLIDQLGEEDQVAIVVYAGSSGCVLDSTNDKRRMRAALNRLEAGGSTNGGSGVELAYRLAEKSFIKGGTNRVILATDGDWNVGITNRGELLDLIKRQAKSGVFLTVLGVGMGNLKDDMLVKLADTGNGNYAYLDTLLEARKMLVEQLSGTLVTIAKDVKIQVEFNPAQVNEYRLIGYEKRMLRKQDFNDDKKDAGEIGAGHTVTALYEVVPKGQDSIAKAKRGDALKYQAESAAKPARPAMGSGEPGDAFVNAYITFQKAEKAQQRGEFETALKDYEAVAATLERLVATGPDWQPAIVAYRQRRTRDAMSAVRQAMERAKTHTTPAAPEPLEKSEARTSSPEEAAADSLLVALEFEQAAKSKAAAGKSTEEPVASKELLTLKLRYKEPEGDTSKLLEFPLTDSGTAWERSSPDFRFAAAVAGYGMLLRNSDYKGEATWSAVAEWAQEGKGDDASGYREEFLGLVEKAQAVCR